MPKKFIHIDEYSTIKFANKLKEMAIDFEICGMHVVAYYFT